VSVVQVRNEGSRRPLAGPMHSVTVTTALPLATPVIGSIAVMVFVIVVSQVIIVPAPVSIEGSVPGSAQ